MIKSMVLGAMLVLAASGAASACTDISSKVVALTGCVDDEWKSTDGQGAQEFVYLTADQNFGLMVITEKEVVPAQQFHDAIVANAVSAAGGDKTKVAVLGERVENLDGKPFNVLEYTLDSGGTPILYQNFYYSQPGFGSVQILTFSLQADGNAAAYKAGIFASTVKIGG